MYSGIIRQGSAESKKPFHKVSPGKGFFIRIGYGLIYKKVSNLWQGFHFGDTVIIQLAFLEFSQYIGEFIFHIG
jgi:hypothetical protein